VEFLCQLLPRVVDLQEAKKKFERQFAQVFNSSFHSPIQKWSIGGHSFGAYCTGLAAADAVETKTLKLKSCPGKGKCPAPNRSGKGRTG
jgi:hypothetical protein